jgi:FkbM family methyltransferase
MTLTTRLRRLALSCGFSVRPVRRFDTELKVLSHFLFSRQIDLVVDVGANEGQFAAGLFEAGYNGNILSFEPLISARERLTAAAAKNPRWQVAPPLALGSQPAKAILHVAGNSISSSLLPMEKLHVQAARNSAEVGQQSVEVERLDNVLSWVTRVDPRRIFLKLDTQGTEKAILEGARGVIDRVEGIKLELSFASLYSGQPLFDEVYEYIRSLGFLLWDIVPGFRHDGTARLLQCDAVFFRDQSNMQVR